MLQGSADIQVCLFIGAPCIPLFAAMTKLNICKGPLLPGLAPYTQVAGVSFRPLLLGGDTTFLPAQQLERTPSPSLIVMTPPPMLPSGKEPHLQLQAPHALLSGPDMCHFAHHNCAVPVK